MPRTTRSRGTQKSRTVLEREPELEALGLGIARGLPGADRSELVERAESRRRATPARRARRGPDGALIAGAWGGR